MSKWSFESLATAALNAVSEPGLREELAGLAAKASEGASHLRSNLTESRPAFWLEDKLLDAARSRIPQDEASKAFQAQLEAPLKLGLDGSDQSRADAAGAGVVTLADYLYSYSQLDPDVLLAVDFSKSDAVDLTNFRELADYMRTHASEGARERLKGFTGEVIAKNHFEALGHQVEMAPNPNTPGWDLQIDGQRYQVKWRNDPAPIHEHFEKYPDIPVIAPGNLAEQFSGDERVVLLADYHAKDALASVNSTHLAVDNLSLPTDFTGLADGLDVGDLGLDVGDLGIPVVALTMSSYRAYRKVEAGDWDESEALEHVLKDTAAVGVGGFVGTQVGLGVGALLAGPTGGLSLVVLPVLGGMFGAGYAKGERERVRLAPVRKAQAAARAACSRLAKEVRKNGETVDKHVMGTVRDHRRSFRRLMLEAVADNGIVELCTHGPTNNFLALEAVANRYRTDAGDAQKAVERIREDVLAAEASDLELEQNLNSATAALLTYRRAIESAVPSLAPQYEAVGERLATLAATRRKHLI